MGLQLKAFFFSLAEIIIVAILGMYSLKVLGLIYFAVFVVYLVGLCNITESNHPIVSHMYRLRLFLIDLLVAIVWPVCYIMTITSFLKFKKK